MPPTDPESATDPAIDPAIDPATDPAMDRALLLGTGQARQQMLRALTPLKPGPLERVLAEMVGAGAQEVGHLFSPRGTALGVWAEGSGDAFSARLVQVVEAQLDAGAAATVRALVATGEPPYRLSMVLGEPGFLRAGAAFTDPERIKGALEMEGVSEAEMERLFAGVEAGTAHPARLGFLYRHPQGGSLVLTTGLHEAPADLQREGLEDLEAPDPGDIHLHRLVGSPEVLWVERPGLKDRALVDWQVEQGLGREEARRAGEAHGVLAVDGPQRILWRQGSLLKSLVYRYPEVGP